jgi:hypothetical protein
MFAPNDSGDGTILRKTLWQQCFLNFSQQTRHLTLRQKALSNQRDSLIFKPNSPILGLKTLLASHVRSHGERMFRPVL